MGAMRWAQTVNYGVLPAPTLPNTFLAQVCGYRWASPHARVDRAS